MRSLFALVLLLTLNGAAVLGQERDLQLAASVTGQRRCAMSASVDALQLTLKLKYTNAGRGKLILYKGNRLFYQIFISRGGEDVAARRSELRATHARYFDEQPEKIVSSAPRGVFTILSPGATYETEQVISVPVARSGEGRFNVSIGAGEHVLNVTASTWYESKKLAEELRERWRDRGFLWTDPVASNRVAFVVDKSESAVVCQ
jgi:hypothetical protein